MQTPRERVRRFGQRDRVRTYGPDYRDRLDFVGFDVDGYVRTLDSMIGASFGLDVNKDIYHCRKTV